MATCSTSRVAEGRFSLGYISKVLPIRTTGADDCPSHGWELVRLQSRHYGDYTLDLRLMKPEKRPGRTDSREYELAE